jgi:hypothetical protein
VGEMCVIWKQRNNWETMCVHAVLIQFYEMCRKRNVRNTYGVQFMLCILKNEVEVNVHTCIRIRKQFYNAHICTFLHF